MDFIKMRFDGCLIIRKENNFTLRPVTAACDVIDQHMGHKRVARPPTEERETDILTPKAPSITFPLANPPVAPEPQVKPAR